MESGTVPAPVRGSGSWPTWIAFVANRIAFTPRAKAASRKRVGVVRSDAPCPLTPFSDVPYMRGIGNNVKSCHRMPCLDGNGRDFDGDTEQVGDTVSCGSGYPRRGRVSCHEHPGVSRCVRNAGSVP